MLFGLFVTLWPTRVLLQPSLDAVGARDPAQARFEGLVLGRTGALNTGPMIAEEIPTTRGIPLRARSAAFPLRPTCCECSPLPPQREAARLPREAAAQLHCGPPVEPREPQPLPPRVAFLKKSNWEHDVPDRLTKDEHEHDPLRIQRALP